MALIDAAARGDLTALHRLLAAGAVRQQVVDALAKTGGNRSAAARLLGISRPTLYTRLRALGLIVP